MRYPVFTPNITLEDISFVTKALKKVKFQGTLVNILTNLKKFASYCGCKYAVAVSNGTSALNLALAAIGIKKG